MHYKYDSERTIKVPEPFKRLITPLFMADDPLITGCNFSVHLTEWEPGCKIDNHSHPDSTEAMYCLAGDATVRINGKEHSFTPGSMIVAPPNVEHEIINSGEELLRVFCIFSPPVTGEDLKKRALQAVEEQIKG